MIMPIDQPIQPELDFSTGHVKASDLPDEVLQIIGHLHRKSQDVDHAITAAQIATDLNIGDIRGRHVRALIAGYQEAFPWIVCALSGRGYFVTQDPEQMEHYDKTLQSLIKSIATRLKSFRANASRCGFDRTDAGERVKYQERTT